MRYHIKERNSKKKPNLEWWMFLDTFCIGLSVTVCEKHFFCAAGAKVVFDFYKFEYQLVLAELQVKTYV